jgi:hypothetical protein
MPYTAREWYEQLTYEGQRKLHLTAEIMLLHHLSPQHRSRAEDYVADALVSLFCSAAPLEYFRVGLVVNKARWLYISDLKRDPLLQAENYDGYVEGLNAAGLAAEPDKDPSPETEAQSKDLMEAIKTLIKQALSEDHHPLIDAITLLHVRGSQIDNAQLARDLGHKDVTEVQRSLEALRKVLRRRRISSHSILRELSSEPSPRAAAAHRGK